MTQKLVSPTLVELGSDIAAFDGAKLISNHIAICQSISATAPVRGVYRFVAASTTPDNNQSQFCIVPGTNPAAGKWLRCDPSIDLVLPVTFATADGASLATIPAEFTLLPAYAAPFLEVTTIWSGGVNPTNGLSFSTPSLGRTKGNLAGAAAGNGGYTSTFFAQMTLGSQFAAGLIQAPVLPPTAQILYDRIVSAFTAGAGNFHIPCHLFATTIVPVAPP